MLVAFDLETHLLSQGRLNPKVVCGSWAGEGDLEGHIGLTDEAMERLKALLEGEDTICGANIAFDFGCAARERPELLPLIFKKYERDQVWDVLVVCALHDIADGLLFKNPDGSPMRLPQGKIMHRYSLELATYRWTGRANAKENDEWRLKYAELEDVPLDEWPEAALQYPKDDAINTLHVAVAQKAAKNAKYIGIQCRAAFAMHMASVWGLRTDGKAVEELESDITERVALADERWIAAGLLKQDGKKDRNFLKQRVIKAYSDAQDKCPTCDGTAKVKGKGKNPINCTSCSGTGFVIPTTVPITATGGVSTDRDTLVESDDKELTEFAGYSMLEKLRDTYLPFVKTGVDYPINIRSNVLVESGRASYDGLIQLLPREGGVRECFVARPGRVFCSVDYAALELCTLAQVCLNTIGESTMAEVINKSGDPGALHTVFAARMLNVPEDEFKARIKAGDPAAKNGRYMAKAANFGFPGGMGAAKLVLAKRKEGLRFCVAAGVSETCGEHKVYVHNRRPIPPTCSKCIEVAQELRDMWFKQWPEVKKYLAYISGFPGIEAGMCTLNAPGTGFQRGRVGFSDGANFGFQSLAAFGAKHALWNVSRECYIDRSSPLHGGRPLVFLHDEILSELPEPRASDAAKRQAEVMVASMREFTPDVAIRAEPAIAKRWYKKMEPVWDGETLKCWEPTC